MQADPVSSILTFQSKAISTLKSTRKSEIKHDFVTFLNHKYACLLVSVSASDCVGLCLCLLVSVSAYVYVCFCLCLLMSASVGK